MNGNEQIQKTGPEIEDFIQMISFTIGSEQFGVRILVVKEIIMIPEITEIPNSPDFVEGVINLRGNIIPVLDLRKRLRLRNVAEADDQKPGTRILVVEIDGNETGFIVDQVSKVITVPGAKVLPPPDIIVAGVQSQYIGGVVHLEDSILIMLDFRKILSMEEKHVLGKVPGMLPPGSARAGQ
jgi:purine-binding chemotaxis protein CheW